MGQTSLKSLAFNVLMRDKQRDTSGTHPVPGGGTKWGFLSHPCPTQKNENRVTDDPSKNVSHKHPWPVLDALNRTYHCAVIPDEDGSGITLYPDAGLAEQVQAAALSFAEYNLTALLKELCLEHLPRRVQIKQEKRNAWAKRRSSPPAPFADNVTG